MTWLGNGVERGSVSGIVIGILIETEIEEAETMKERETGTAEIEKRTNFGIEMAIGIGIEAVTETEAD
jgi:hypothetical protein